MNNRDKDFEGLLVASGVPVSNAGVLNCAERMKPFAI